MISLQVTSRLLLATRLLASAIDLAPAAEDLDDQTPATIRRSWRLEWDKIQAEIARLATLPADEDPYKDPHIFDDQALIWPTDRDPLDVALRRTLALAAKLEHPARRSIHA
jgi:hypothetical protein